MENFEERDDQDFRGDAHLGRFLTCSREQPLGQGDLSLRIGQNGYCRHALAIPFGLDEMFQCYGEILVCHGGDVIPQSRKWRELSRPIQGQGRNRNYGGGHQGDEGKVRLGPLAKRLVAYRLVWFQ